MFVGIQDDKDEWLKSELPALEQLKAMGYEYKSQANLNKERKDFREVLLYDRLEKALRKHNPEIDDEGIYDALGQIRETNFPYNLDPVDTNEKIRAKLVGLSRTGGLEPITVTQTFEDGNKEKTIRLFDFDNPKNNDFLVTNQFQLEGFKEPIYPDIIVFVNGIPLVVIECKSPYIRDAIPQAVDKNFARYQSRGSGYERLIYYNHFLIATSGIMARHGTIGSSVNHYARWSSHYPFELKDIEKLCRGRKLREQEILIAGMLDKSHLIDLLKNYVIYDVINNKRIKKLAKHQQYRVVTKSVERLKNFDEKSVADKGGVVWHTQGSGKSLSMLWFATQLMYKLGNPPIIIVTDRKQLDRQIHDTFKASGFPTPIKAQSSRQLEYLLKNPKGKTIMTTIQKFGTANNLIHTDEKVIVLVDEAHRTQYKITAEAMRMAMPNAVFFAFSGTPLDKKDRSTYRVFGPLLDKYSIEESQKDGATIPIRYEGRMPHLFVESAESVDRIFERIFADLTKEQQGKLKREYVTKEKIAEAPARIRKICDDLIQHFETTIQPNGYKGIVVAPTREAAVTYKKELEKLGGPLSKIIMTSNLGERGSDGSSWDEYYLTPEQREAESERFKDPQDPTQLLIVVDMLLVGYDAPIVQVLYLDHVLKEHTLLQAIARVNRVYDAAKTFGLIVDYCGITRELQNALAIFDYEDVKGALEPTEKEFQELKLRHAETMAFFDGIDKNDDSIIIEKFEPAGKRDEFDYAFKMFSKTMDAVLPKKEAHPYLNDFKYAVKIRQMLRTYYESSVTSLRVEGKKIQQIIDEHIRSLNIIELMEPRRVTNENFLTFIVEFKKEKARTALVKNKVRQIISEFAPNNPVYYQKLKERLEKIIKEEERRRKESADYFNRYKEILEDALGEEKERKKLGFTTGFEFAVYEQLFQLLKDKKISKSITHKIYDGIRGETQIVDWTNKRSAEKNISIIVYDLLEKEISEHLPKNRLLKEEKISELADDIVDLAKQNLQ